jgi:hypothetical protein
VLYGTVAVESGVASAPRRDSSVQDYQTRLFPRVLRSKHVVAKNAGFWLGLSFQSDPSFLAPSPQGAEPVTIHLSVEAMPAMGVGGNGVVGEGCSHHVRQPRRSLSNRTASDRMGTSKASTAACATSASTGN